MIVLRNTAEMTSAQPAAASSTRAAGSQCASPKQVMAAPDRLTYTDLAIAPPLENELDTLDLFHVTSGGEAAVARSRRDDAARARTAVAAD